MKKISRETQNKRSVPKCNALLLLNQRRDLNLFLFIKKFAQNMIKSNFDEKIA